MDPTQQQEPSVPLPDPVREPAPLTRPLWREVELIIQGDNMTIRHVRGDVGSLRPAGSAAHTRPANTVEIKHPGGAWCEHYPIATSPATPHAIDGGSISSNAVAVPPATLPVLREELKMVLCVNQALSMGKGKIGAQCAHAAVGVIGKYRQGNEVLFRLWERHGQPNVALKVPNEEIMAELAHKALQCGLPCYTVYGAGRMQVAAASQTVLAIGPGYKSDVDKVTGHLKLL